MILAFDTQWQLSARTSGRFQQDWVADFAGILTMQPRAPVMGERVPPPQPVSLRESGPGRPGGAPAVDRWWHWPHRSPRLAHRPRPVGSFRSLDVDSSAFGWRLRRVHGEMVAIERRRAVIATSMSSASVKFATGAKVTPKNAVNAGQESTSRVRSGRRVSFVCRLTGSSAIVPPFDAQLRAAD